MDEDASEQNWLDTQRLEAWAGEIRVNLIRILALVLFYGRHLVEYFIAPGDAAVRRAYHERITWLCLIWAGAAAALHMRLIRRQVPRELKYLSTLLDTGMITLLCALNGGPKSPLILLYVLVIAASPLRLSLRHAYVSTACAIGGYLVLLAHYAWYVVGFQKYYATPELRIPRRDEAIIVLTLFVAGLFAAQAVRQARRIAQRYPVTASTDVAAQDAPNPATGEGQTS